MTQTLQLSHQTDGERTDVARPGQSTSMRRPGRLAAPEIELLRVMVTGVFSEPPQIGNKT